VSPRRVPEGVRKKVIGLALGKYRDINDTHLCEILSKAEGIVMGEKPFGACSGRRGSLPSERSSAASTAAAGSARRPSE